MKTLKLVCGFVLVSLLSAIVAIGTYSYLNGKNGNNPFNFSSDQQGFRTVGYATPAENTDFTYAAEQSVNAVVHIKSVTKPSERSRSNRGYINPFDFFFGGDDYSFQPYQRRPRVGFGSGVIISSDGYIVTNNHVIEGADEIEVKTNDDKVYTAKIIGSDNITDVALLKIEGKDFHALPFGDSDVLKVGEWVLAVGNPFNLTSTVTAGIVSAKGRGDIAYDNTGDNGAKIQSYIQTDAAVNPGNSGGALVNTKGELIGINAAIYTETGSFMGYSFAIPINIVKKIVTDIKQYGIVQRAILGIKYNELSDLKEIDSATYNKLKVNEGVYVADFPINSTSQKAGIQVGDVVTAINGTKIKNGQDLRAQLSQYSPGNKVDVQIYRGDAVKTYTVELKNDQGTTEIVKQKLPKDILGATLKELSDEVKTRLGISYGVEVTELGNGKLKSAGIRNGFIILTANDTRISSQEDMEDVVATILKKDADDRGLYIKGFYPNTRRIEYTAIDLND
ncbi:MAG: Do family serine endopeptidase [Candidatus Azobacteroides sp.]|nr:Do family serine endopeptidase [Candidatus Azobacteroides sp.]